MEGSCCVHEGLECVREFFGRGFGEIDQWEVVSRSALKMVFQYVTVEMFFEAQANMSPAHRVKCCIPQSTYFPDQALQDQLVRKHRL